MVNKHIQGTYANHAEAVFDRMLHDSRLEGGGE
jgi:hypothetical protein